MVKTYFVIAKETCPECGGDKMVEHLISGTFDQFTKVECPTCHGDGIVKDEIPLETAIAELTSRNSSIREIAGPI